MVELKRKPRKNPTSNQEYEVLERGVSNILDDKEQPYEIRTLNIHDLDNVMELQEHVLGLLTKAELAFPFTESELRFILEGNGESVGMVVNGKLLACCSLLSNVKKQENMALELDFDDRDLGQVEQLEMAMTHVSLRGHKLQQKLAGILVERAEKRNQARYLFSTVSPYNYPSIQTVTSLGLLIAKVSRMYNDWDRYVVYKDLVQPEMLDKSEVISIPNTDLLQQQKLLDKGYRGFSLKKTEEGILILFAKKEGTL